MNASPTSEPTTPSSAPLVLEIGCGRGDYTTGLAEQFPEKNFIGIDIKGSRIWHGAQYAQTHQLTNIAFLRTQIQSIDHFFAPEEVDEIYIPFPDPRPRDSDEKRRLTCPKMIEKYKGILKKNGSIFIKTDSQQLFEYTLEALKGCNVHVIAQSSDFYQSPHFDQETNIQTTYEKKFLKEGKKINYIQFKFE